METIDLIIYLGRVKSALDDMQCLQEHEVPYSTETKVALKLVHEELLRQIKTRPDVGMFVKFTDVANSEELV